jgi:hypothetical protein
MLQPGHCQIILNFIVRVHSGRPTRYLSCWDNILMMAHFYKEQLDLIHNVHDALSAARW